MSSLIRHVFDPFQQSDFFNVADPIERTFDRAFNTAQPWQLDTSVSPRLLIPVDLVESNDSFKYYFDLPGVAKEDVDMNISNNLLTITATKKELFASSDTLHRRERSSGKCQRTFRLPDGIDHDSAEATFKDGILCVSFKKRTGPAGGIKLRIA
eukprot:gene6759-13700_t